MESDYIASLMKKRRYADVDDDDESTDMEGGDEHENNGIKEKKISIVEQVREARRKREAALALPKSRLPSVMDWVDTEKNRVADTRRYFSMEPRKAEMSCKLCRCPGHVIRNCPQQVKECVLCEEDHNPVYCPLNTLCHQCYRLGHARPDCRSRRLEKLCMYCHMNNHATVECPMVWRQYHLSDDETIRNPAFARHCYNCGRKGHLGDDCPEENHNNIPDFYWHSAFRMDADAPPAPVDSTAMNRGIAEGMDVSPETNDRVRCAEYPDDSDHDISKGRNGGRLRRHNDADDRHSIAKDAKQAKRLRSAGHSRSPACKDSEDSGERQNDDGLCDDDRRYDSTKMPIRSYSPNQQAILAPYSRQMTPSHASYTSPLPTSYNRDESPSPPPFPVKYMNQAAHQNGSVVGSDNPDSNYSPLPTHAAGNDLRDNVNKRSTNNKRKSKALKHPGSGGGNDAENQNSNRKRKDVKNKNRNGTPQEQQHGGEHNNPNDNPQQQPQGGSNKKVKSKKMSSLNGSALPYYKDGIYYID
ncbi:hypothetical protein SeLEV6574_g03046 [Synchytrium endobioticum]|nr:hypothetical protein SeLEV6574_g03046 [Synchytrium endobioticum]